MPAFRITPASLPPAQTPNKPAATPTELEAASSGRNLRPLQDVLEERRVRDGSAPIPWGGVLSKLPAKLDG